MLIEKGISLYVAMATVVYNGCREAFIYREVGFYDPFQ